MRDYSVCSPYVRISPDGIPVTFYVELTEDEIRRELEETDILMQQQIFDDYDEDLVDRYDGV